jgi:hypothetical protein
MNIRTRLHTVFLILHILERKQSSTYHGSLIDRRQKITNSSNRSVISQQMYTNLFTFRTVCISTHTGERSFTSVHGLCVHKKGQTVAEQGRIWYDIVTPNPSLFFSRKTISSKLVKKLPNDALTIFIKTRNLISSK